MAAETIGFDFNRGRLDVTDHPFCTGLGPDDCRITTRYDECYFPTAFFGILHEAGHGIYDQGLPRTWFGLPPGSYISLGIHESQSRMWENMVGRSRAFWQYFLPKAQQVFPDALSDVELEPFYASVNDVQPSLIRVEADEATYNLHIIVRFELEQDLIDGKLDVADLPAVWNDRYEEYLGIRPSNHADGVLQDIHWSAASIGYFPTYSLGNIYAAQLFAQAEADVGRFDRLFARGDFRPLLAWLRENVHLVGQRHPAHQLVERTTHASLKVDPLIDYLHAKYAEIYDLD